MRGRGGEKGGEEGGWGKGVGRINIVHTITSKQRPKSMIYLFKSWFVMQLQPFGPAGTFAGSSSALDQ